MSDGGTERIGPGWYVIEGPHQDPAKVVAGPKDGDAAESHARFLTDPNAKIMHTPALVNAIKNEGYNVEWSEQAEKPRSLNTATHYANDPNIPHKSADPDDVGVVAYYRDLEAHSSEQSAIACDRWETQRENARAIALWVRRIRLADRCGVETARDIDEVAQLPPAGGDASGAIAAPPAQSDTDLGGDPHEVLGVAPDAPDDVVEAVARRLSANVHPDGADPDVEEYKRIQKAKEAILDD